jgi:Domain of unknown function (DUF4340)
MMTARGTALLVGVLLALVTYIWLAEVEPRRHVSGAEAAAEAAPLLTVPPGAIARVALEERGARLTALRHEGTWVDEQGRSWRGDAVSGLVETLGSLRPVMVVESEPMEPTEYGLGPDAPRLELSAEDGRPVLALELGQPNPAATGVYARMAGRREVVLIGALLRWELDKLRDAAPRG